MKVKEGCGPCGATGIYRGFAEPTGIGVISGDCGGEGFKLKEQGDVASNRIVEGRKQREDVQRVHWSAGSFIGIGVGPTKYSISYDEFLAGKKPQKEYP